MLLLSISKLNLAHITKSPQSKEYPETIKKKKSKGAIDKINTPLDVSQITPHKCKKTNWVCPESVIF